MLSRDQGVECLLTLGRKSNNPAIRFPLRPSPIVEMVQQGRALETPGGPRMNFDTQATRILLQYDEGGRRFEEAVDDFLETLRKDGPGVGVVSALADGYRNLGFQTLADQVEEWVCLKASG